MTKSEMMKYSAEAVHRGFLVWRDGGTESEVDAAIRGDATLSKGTDAPKETQQEDNPALAYVKNRARARADSTAAAKAALNKYFCQ